LAAVRHLCRIVSNETRFRTNFIKEQQNDKKKPNKSRNHLKQYFTAAGLSYSLGRTGQHCKRRMGASPKRSLTGISISLITVLSAMEIQIAVKLSKKRYWQPTRQAAAES